MPLRMSTRPPNRLSAAFVAVLLLVCPAVVAAAAPSGTYDSFKVKTGGEEPAEIAGWYLPAKGKAKGTLFVDLVSDLAESSCWEEDPACPDCPMHGSCPTGAVHRPAPAVSKKPR